MERLVAAAILFGGLLISSAYADELNYNLYSLQSSVSDDIANDLMVVNLVATHQSAKAEEASTAVNRDMSWALNNIDKGKVSTRTDGYTTSPEYKNSKITRWTVTQSLRLESEDFEFLTDLVTELQGRLQVRSMTFGVKPETRAAFENDLISKVLESYRQRAQIIADSMQASGYDMVGTHINTQNTYSPVYSRAQSSRFESFASSDIAVESGESKVTVTVSGEIQLQF